MTDKEKLNAIRAEVKNYIYAAHKAHTNITEGNFAHLLSFIDSLQEEPASEELEEVAEDYALDDYIKPWRELVKGAFKDGSKWHKKQMMAKAVDGYVIEDIEEGNGDFLLSTEYLPKSMDLKDRQKVKVIVIKED